MGDQNPVVPSCSQLFREQLPGSGASCSRLGGFSPYGANPPGTTPLPGKTFGQSLSPQLFREQQDRQLFPVVPGSSQLFREQLNVSTICGGHDRSVNAKACA